MRLSIVIPCYNESKNIPLVFERFNEIMRMRDAKDIELILVNNGSTDDSQAVMESLVQKYKSVCLGRVSVNKGYGFGILYGLSLARGEFLSWTHADMQTDPYDAVRAFKIIEQAKNPKSTLVKGLRKGRPLTDVFFTLGMGIFEKIYLGVPMFDINAQPNLFHRSFFVSWPKPPHDFSLDLYAFYMARKQGLEVIRFPVLFKKRLYGHSHWNFNWKSKLKFIKRTAEFSFKLRKELRKAVAL